MRFSFRYFLGGMVCAVAWASAQAMPALQCEVTYAGAPQVFMVRPVQDPYPVAAEDIRGRFRFKPVVVGSATQVDRVLVYVYQHTATQPVLVQQAKYLPPFHWPADGSPLPLTGQQHVYAGPMERELIYSCALHRSLP